MKTKEITLLILIVAGGIFFYHAQTGKIHFDLIWWDDGFFFPSNEYDFEESQVLTPPFPRELAIFNAHGDINIRGTAEKRMTISFQKKIWRSKEEQAREVNDLLKINIERDLDQWIISTNRNEFRRKNFRTNFRITLPAGMDVKVENSYGLVKISKAGNTNITNRHGKIIASDIHGALKLQNSYRDIEVENAQSGCHLESKHSRVYIHRIQGKSSIIHRYGKVHLENISQAVRIEGSNTEVYGKNLSQGSEIKSSYRKISLFAVGPTKINGHHSEIEVEEARGSLDIRNDYGRVKISNLQGDLSVKGKNMSVYGNSISGEEIFISSSYRTIELLKFSGKTTILLSNAEVILEPSPLTHPVEVKGKYVDIDFIWPSGGKYPIEAKAKSGNIKWALPFEMSEEEENSLLTLKAFLNEKKSPSILLSTTYGTIRIEE